MADALQELRSLGAVERGPRASDLTVRLARTADLIPAAEAVCRSMALATVVATDETAGPDADFKVRYVFEPATAGAPDQFVTLLVGADAARPEVPSLTRAVPAANWHEREMQDLFGIVPAGHPDPRSLVVHDGWPRGVFPLRKTFDAEHKSQFGHMAPDEPVEVVSYRVRGTGLVPAVSMPKFTPQVQKLSDALRETRQVRFNGATVCCAVYQREKLDVGLTLRGPAILDQFDCTTVICAGQVARVDEWKNLIVTEEK